MHIVLMASGTRGDVQPVIALGKALKSTGHRVRIMAGSNFSAWIESHGLEAFPILDMEALMQSELGVKWVESKSQFEQLKYMKALLHANQERYVTDTINGTKGAELLIGGFVAEPFLQAISEKHGIPLITAALQPYRATRSGPATLMPLRPHSDSILNLWMGRVGERFMWSIAADVTNVLRTRLDLPTHTAGTYIRTMNKIPALYAVSPLVMQDSTARVTGYWFLDEDYTPPADLLHFIESGDPPVYVGFGSMSSSDPARTVNMIVDALAKVGERGVLARGWSGAAVTNLPSHIHVLDKTSHTWLFPRMAAVVHHGGAGTTAAALRAGKPMFIIPHLGDQPFWGRRMHELGVSVKPIPRPKLTAQNFTSSLDTLLKDSRSHANAAALGEKIRAEDGVENAVNWIRGFIRPSEW